MNTKDTYKSRKVGGMAVIAMPFDTLGNEYKRSEGKNGVIYFRPVEQFKPRETQIEEAEKNLKEDLTYTEA